MAEAVYTFNTEQVRELAAVCAEIRAAWGDWANFRIEEWNRVNGKYVEASGTATFSGAATRLHLGFTGSDRPLLRWFGFWFGGREIAFPERWNLHLHFDPPPVREQTPA